MNGPVLELRDVELMIGDKQILSGVNLHVHEGERLVVLGESGGGKSTILRIILGMLRATSGSRGRLRDTSANTGIVASTPSSSQSGHVSFRVT